MHWYETVIIALGTSFAGGFGGWVFGRRKNDAEAKQVELQNVSNAITIWREAAEKLSNQLALYNEQLSVQRQINAELRQKVDELTEEVRQLKKQNCALQKQLKSFNDANKPDQANGRPHQQPVRKPVPSHNQKS